MHRSTWNENDQRSHFFYLAVIANSKLDYGVFHKYLPIPAMKVNVCDVLKHSMVPLAAPL